MIEEESKELTGVGVEKSLKLAKHLDERNSKDLAVQERL